MKKQAFNPYLPSWEYLPDGEPYVFGDRLYVYGSHDRFNGATFCMNDYVCWSTPVSDLSDWRYEGVIYRKTQDPKNSDGNLYMYAPDIQQGPDGRYYLYYTLGMEGQMSVAVGEGPLGPFEYYGQICRPDGRVLGSKAGDIYQFDPGIFVDDDGRIYLYSGFGVELEGGSDASKTVAKGRLLDGAYCIELEPDMKTTKGAPKQIVPGYLNAQGTEFDGHSFFEASSLRKINGTYYFIYSSINGHELCYATSDKPDSSFAYGGVIISNGDVGLEDRPYEQAVAYMGNNHGSLVQVHNQWYIFYHRQTNRHSYSRQGCAEPVDIQADGSILQVEMTSCGLNGGPLVGTGRYEAYIACNLFSKKGAGFYGVEIGDFTEHPYLTQSGVDREGDGDQYIANLRNGAIVGFKYFLMQGAHEIAIEVRGLARGEIEVLSSIQGEIIGRITVGPSEEYTTISASLIRSLSGVMPLFFRYIGNGALDFRAFTLL